MEKFFNSFSSLLNFMRELFLNQLSQVPETVGKAGVKEEA